MTSYKWQTILDKPWPQCVCVCTRARVCYMTWGHASNSNDRAVVAEGGPTRAVWLTLAVTPGFTWGKYARLPLSLTSPSLSPSPFLWKVLFSLLTAPQHVFYLNLYAAVRILPEGWRGSVRTLCQPAMMRMVKVEVWVEVNLAEQALNAFWTYQPLICKTANFKPALHQQWG